MRSAHYVSNLFPVSRSSDIFCMENMTQAVNFVKVLILVQIHWISIWLYAVQCLYTIVQGAVSYFVRPPHSPRGYLYITPSSWLHVSIWLFATWKHDFYVTARMCTCTLSVEHVHPQLSMCTLVTLTLQHVHAPSWACARSQLSMCMLTKLTFQHVHTFSWACARVTKTNILCSVL